MMTRATMGALLLLAAASPATSQDEPEAPWVCVPTEKRGWLCGRGASAPRQTPLPEAPPPAPPPPGYTAPAEPTRLPGYLRNPEAGVAAPDSEAGPVSGDGDEAAEAGPDSPGPETIAEPQAPPRDAGPESARPAAAEPPPAGVPLYGVQLVAVRDAGALEAFIARHGLDETALDLHRRQWRDGGGAWHVLVAGRYATVSGARRVLESLPAEIREGGAWVRRIDLLESPDTESD